jgi:hypothetical protein
MRAAIALTLLVLAACASPALHAQATDSTGVVLEDDEGGQGDAVLPSPVPSSRPRSREAPSASAPAASGDGQPVTFSAADSLILSLAPPVPDTLAQRDSLDDSDGDAVPFEQAATLYGTAKATYDEATLEAAEVTLYLDQDELRARPDPSDETGQRGIPTFTRGEETFTGRELAYNLSTERGRIVRARTRIEDGYLLGGVVKQSLPSVIYVEDGAYTTCDNPDHVHYEMRAEKMKIVDGEWVYTGPVRLYLLGVPTPIWLPFGLLPAAEGRRSGPLPVQYGEDASYGFYLSNVGWYWAASPYWDLTVSGKTGTKGSYEVRPSVRYTKRYAFSGNLNLGYASLRSGQDNDPSGGIRRTYNLGWRHQQTFEEWDASLNGDVRLSSQEYLRAVSTSFEDNVQRQLSQSIGFNKRFAGGQRSVSVNLAGRQDLQTDLATLSFPNVSFRQSAITPFKREPQAGRQEAWYEKVRVQYDGSFQNNYRFQPLPDSTLAQRGIDEASWIEAYFDQGAYRETTGDSLGYRFDARATHRVPVTASFQAGPVTLTPNVNYAEDWNFRRQRRFVNPETGRIDTEEEVAFTPIRTVSAGVGASTEAFGTFPLRVGPLDGLRHTLRPSVNLNLAPGYDGGLFDYFRTVPDTLDRNGDPIRYPITATTGLSDRPTRTSTFRLQNVFETRIARTDSTGEVERTKLTLFNLDANSGYDFAADSLGFSPVSLSLRSSIGRRLDLSASGQFSVYANDAGGRDRDALYYDVTGRPLRPTSYTASVRTRFGGERAAGTTPRPFEGALGADRPTGLPIDPYRDDPFGERLDPWRYSRQVVDFAVPWSLALSLDYRFRPNYRAGGESTRTLALNVTQFDLSLTPNWKISGTSGYDFEEKEITATRLRLLRDLHCWQMSFDWVPLGDYKSFAFSIFVKSGKLADFLRLDFPRNEGQSPFDRISTIRP